MSWEDQSYVENDSCDWWMSDKQKEDTRDPDLISSKETDDMGTTSNKVDQLWCYNKITEEEE